MDQTKKAANAWGGYEAHRAEVTTGPNGYGGPLWDGVIMRWVDSSFSSQLPENSATGPIWAMHMLPDVNAPNGGALPGERGAAGGDVGSIPLTNAITDAYIHIIWPSARVASRWRGHNLNGDWGSTRVPWSTRLDAKNQDGVWVTIDNGPSILNLVGDTGYRTVAPALATEHRLFLGTGGGGQSAQSLCFLDIKFNG